jgi:hypothetical protein
MAFDYSGASRTSGSGDSSGGNTFIIPNTGLTIGNRHMCIYTNLDTGLYPTGYELGGGNGVDNALIISYGESTGYFSFGAYQTYTNPTLIGFYYTQVSGSTSPYNMVGYQNGVQVIIGLPQLIKDHTKLLKNVN